jgi:hypothetical protein
MMIELSRQATDPPQSFSRTIVVRRSLVQFKQRKCRLSLLENQRAILAGLNFLVALVLFAGARVLSLRGDQ